jgi:plastocyanin domain-containing protein
MNRGKEMRIKLTGKTIAIVVMLFLVSVVCRTSSVQAQRRAKRKTSTIQRVTVALTEKGYQPAGLKLRRGIPAQVTFIRKVSATCGTDVLIPEYDIKRALPLNEPVLVAFTPNKSGRFNFSCGMGMLHGSLIVQ